MLGTRTKRINTYGKRSQRIVSVSEEGAITRTRAAPAPSIFDDMPAVQLVPLAVKMKNRENAIAKRPKHTSPKPIKKKQSPLRQKAMSKMVQHSAIPTKPTKKELPSTPSRAPLAVYLPNIPNSPAISHKFIHKALNISSKHGTPNRTIKPFVDTVTDIILLDNDGQTVSHERRVSPHNHKAPAQTASSPSSSESGSEVQVLRKLASRKRTNRVIIISDDDSSSSDEEASPSRITNRSASTRAPPYQKSVKVEVLVPSPPPSLARLMKSRTAPLEDDEIISSPQISNHYPYASSPIVKPRPLTPLRPHRKALFTPASPPSPLSDSELDIDLELSELSLGLSLTDEERPPVPEYLRPLIQECQQVNSGLYEFSAFIDTFPYDEVVRSSARNGTDKLKFRKVGEASYSEVFGIGDVVLKVIPIRDPDFDSSMIPPEEDGPFPSEAKDVLKEIIVTRAMGEVDERFVKLLRTYVVRGRYPQLLLELWDEYLRKNGSESIRPDTFGVSQTYVIIALPDGGPDLESFNFSTPTKNGWRQVCSVFWQVTRALAHGEQMVSFEHRDLHWGQILIKSTPISTAMPMQERMNQVPKTRSPRAFMDDPAHGLRVTVIDLGLARMDAGDGAGGEMVHWTPLDDEVFMGQGDYQFDVYRLMREQHEDHWDVFLPLTNVMWLHYLLVKLMRHKRLKPPAAPRKGQSGAVPSSAGHFSEKECYESLLDLEQWLGECIKKHSSKAKLLTKAKKRGKAGVVTEKETGLSPVCAGEVVEYGIKKGWIAGTGT